MNNKHENLVQDVRRRKCEIGDGRHDEWIKENGGLDPILLIDQYPKDIRSDYFLATFVLGTLIFSFTASLITGYSPPDKWYMLSIFPVITHSITRWRWLYCQRYIKMYLTETAGLWQ